MPGWTMLLWFAFCQPKCSFQSAHEYISHITHRAAEDKCHRRATRVQWDRAYNF
ncbi:hypothetical protein Q9966_013720 [Columba livia]|nr:hypothetical protein Q9966_013720 [Columba livia]